MGVSSGPYNPRDGLVLWYDIANSLSFKGEPVTNFFQNGHFSNGQGIPGEAGSNPTNDIIRFPNPGDSDWVLRQTGPGQFTEYQITLTTQLASSTTYVMSGWYAESNDYQGADGSRMFHARAFSSTGAHQATGIDIGTVIETKVVAGIIWKYCYQTITTPSNYSNQFDWYLGYGNFTFSGNRYYTNIQLEVGTYPKKFANGTRGTTVALGGGIQDLTGRGNNAELINGPTASTLNGGFIILDGTNDYIRFPLTSTSAISISCWVRSSSWSTQAHPMIVAKGINVEWILWKSDDASYDEKFGWRISNSTTLYSTTTAQNNVWYHLVATVGASGMRLWVNGVLEASNGTTAAPTGSIDPCIGSGLTSNTPSNFLLGNIAAVQIWNKQISATEVSQIYQSLRTRFVTTRQSIVTSGLVYSLDAGDPNSYKGTGTTWRDNSGYLRTATLVNSPKFRGDGGGSIQLDGIDDVILGPTIGSIGKIPFHTFEIWVKTPGLGTNKNKAGLICPDYGMIFDISLSGDVVYSLYTTDNGYPGSYVFNGNTTGVNVYDDKWHHIVCTRGTSTCTVYIDGVSRLSGGNGGSWSGETLWSNSMSISIGNDPNDIYHNLRGNIAIARIYNRGLSQAEVLQNYEATKARFNK